MGPFGNHKGAGIDELECLQLSGTDGDCIMQPITQSKLPRRQIMKRAVAGMALSSLLATAFYCSGFSTISTIALKHDDILREQLDKELDKFVGLAAEPSTNKKFAHCEQLVMIKHPHVVQNNLGGKGPDAGEEGMIFNASVFMKDDKGHVIAGKNVTVAVHAKSAYAHDKNVKNTFNGVYGKFLSILMHSGTSLSFNISIYDGDTNEPFTLPYFSITFFDLDTSEKRQSKEYVIAQNFSHYYVANGTQIKVTENEDGTTKFSASEKGTGGDNPTESEALEPIAKSKGVTLQYLGRNSVDFTIGAEHGDSLRGFLFTLRPSLLCAKTHLNGEWVDPMNTSIPGVELPLMDGKVPVPGMEIPILRITENGTVIIVTDNSSKTLGNVSDVIANNNGTVTINESNGTHIVDDRFQGKASAKSGTKALLIVMTLLAVVWPLSIHQ